MNRYDTFLNAQRLAEDENYEGVVCIIQLNDNDFKYKKEIDVVDTDNVVQSFSVTKTIG